MATLLARLRGDEGNGWSIGEGKPENGGIGKTVVRGSES
jgi:hypothetical protein